MDPAIHTRALTKRYGDAAAVSGLSLDVPRGSVFGFVGPNGAGKTTTIRMLLGLVRPTSGEAAILGHDVRRGRAALASLVGAMVETPAFPAYLTGRECLHALALAAGLSARQARLEALLEQVGLAPAGGRPVGEYSLGMRQRLGLAAALLGDPPVLFLDEPTNGLDPEGAREVRDLLGTLRAAGRTIFLSSHLLGEVERICDAVAIVQGGVVRRQGALGELLAGRASLELRVSDPARARALLGAAAGEDPGPGWVSARLEEAAVPGALRTLLGAGVDVFEVRPQRASLEQVFFEATR